jgi:hypothetical protein
MVVVLIMGRGFSHNFDGFVKGDLDGRQDPSPPSPCAARRRLSPLAGLPPWAAKADGRFRTQVRSFADLTGNYRLCPEGAVRD